MTPLGALAGAGIGVTLGLLGGGGSILTVPVFVYLLGFGAKESIAMSLAVVGFVSAVGSVSHWRAGNVQARIALIFGIVAMGGTYLGARLAVFLSGSAQLALFAIVMLMAAVAMLRGPRTKAKTPSPDRPRFGLIAVEGLAVGVLTGLVGVGGGFLIVPALVLLGGLPMKHAVGTSLLIIALKSVAGFAGYIGQIEVPWAFMTQFALIAAVGIVAGASLTKVVPHVALQRAFAGLLLVVGVAVLYANRGALLGKNITRQSSEIETSAPYVHQTDDPTEDTGIMISRSAHHDSRSLLRR